jgi:hypothetical protein
MVLVPREQLRFKRHGRCFALPVGLPKLMEALPAAPSSFDGSKGRTIKYPILGNDQQGDCYLTDACHCIQTWTGNALGTPASFNTADVLKLYHQLSGGDNGLGDDQIFPAWKKGIFGHKILDEMTLNIRDGASIRFAMWKFFGASFTCSLLGGRRRGGWLDIAGPGVIWDAGMAPDSNAGHAMHWSGYTPDYYLDETWGIDPAVKVTQAGVNAADSEITVQFSLEMFDPQTGLAPDGESYEQKATWWAACGGSRLPPSPFPPAPTPPTPPVDWGPDVDWN